MSDLPNLGDIWNWLPTFRVVAETEHLPTASKRLHVTPAAISRTLGLLEDRMGRELFNRTGNRLVLNGDGRRLLEAVSEAMSKVERGLHSLEDSPLSGPVHVSAGGVLTNHYVVPAMLELSNRHEGLEPQVRNMRTGDATQALLEGTLDVAFIYESMTLDGIHVERLGESPSSIYCGCEHPLFDGDDVSLEELTDHPFSVPQIGDTGQIMDGWPADVDRTVGMRITLLTSNLAVCRSGQYLTVLPDVTARPFVEAGQLRRFDIDILPPAPLYAARRESTVSESGRARGVIDAVRARTRDIEQQLDDFRASTG